MTQKLTKRLLATLRPQSTCYYVHDSVVRGFQARVNMNGSITFCVIYRLSNKKRQRYTIGSASIFSPEQARDIAVEHIAAARRGENPKYKKDEKETPSFKSFIENEYTPWLSMNRKTGTYMGDTLLKAFPLLTDLALDSISPFHIEKWRKQMHEKGRSNGTINRQLTYLKAALNRAKTWGFIETNPLADVKKERENPGKVRYLSDDEHTRLLTALDAREERIRAERDSYNAWARARGYDERPDLRALPYADYLKPMVLLSLNTGMRQGEVFALDWSDINLTQKIITLRSENTKSGKTRHIPMNDTVLTLITDWQSQTGSSGFVFPSPKTGGKFDNVKKAWMEVLKSADITNFRWHDMRHDFASKLVMAGADLYVVKELLGHSTIQMTERYAHLAPSATAAAVSLLDPQPQVKPKSTAKKSRKQKSS